MDQKILVSPIQRYLDSLYQRFLPLGEGKVADYIPELALANPDSFGIALVTVDGHVYQSGDTREQFTIQSISKALVYGLALEDNGVEAVTARIGVEPSGDAFNSISLEDGTGRPVNPMINAGAIATTGMVKGADREERLARILNCLGRYMGQTPEVDEVVYASERDTGHRNRAIAHMLRNFDILTGEPEDALDLYFRQCSIKVTCQDLALAAATLANRGVNPITGVVALQSGMVGKVLSVMSTCGMYDYAGSWIYEVGLPAKSGVGGGIMAVLPGQLGLAVYSPPLDDRGNSVRGIAVCREVSSDFELHLFNAARIAPSVIRAQYTGSGMRSKRIRSGEQTELLREQGNRIHIYELHGDLAFGTTEIVIHNIADSASEVDYLILDFRRVYSIDGAAGKLLLRLCESFLATGKQVLSTHTGNKFEFQRMLRRGIERAGADQILGFEERDRALEWCEDRLLEQAGIDSTWSEKGGLKGQDFVKGLDAKELDQLEKLMNRKRYKAGEYITRKGDPADNIFFLVKGTVTVLLPLNNKTNARLATISPGMVFGEAALVEKSRRTADLCAESDVECYALPTGALEDPLLVNIRSRLVESLARGLADKLRNANLEIQSLS